MRFFSSCIESLPFISIEKPLLIFVDLEVPDVNDLLINDLLKETYDNSVPVVVTYSNQSEKNLTQYKELKYQPKNYCKKPLSNDHIFSILQNHLERESEEDDDILVLSEEEEEENVTNSSSPMVDAESEE